MTRKLAALGCWVLLVVAAFGPLLANDVPLFARVDGTWYFPAAHSYREPPGPAPDGRTWKQFWAADDLADGDFAVMPPWPYGPFEIHSDAFFAGPSIEHPLGNDDTGRDLLARLIHGANTAAKVALGAVLLAFLLGLPLGGSAGLTGGAVDFVVLRLIEIFSCFPALIAALAAAAFFGGSTLLIVAMLGLVYWVPVARVVRAEFLSLREREFVHTARGLGVGPWSLFYRHMLPCIRGPLLVTAAFVAASAIIVESTFTFLGLGLGLETVSWGAMLRQGKLHAHRGTWHLWLFPALTVALTVLSLHGVGSFSQRRSSAKS